MNSNREKGANHAKGGTPDIRLLIVILLVMTFVLAALLALTSAGYVGLP